MNIGDKKIGTGRPTLVMAEIGVNHDGSVDRAIELVRAAKTSGADAVKLQVFRAEQLMHASAGFAEYQQNQCDDADPTAMLRRYELSTDDLHRIMNVIREEKLLAIATPFSPADVETIALLDVDAIKIASPDLVNPVLLKRAAGCGKPLILSTGAATIAEVESTVAWLRERRVQFALLHCISSYPTPLESANLCWVGELHSRFGVPVGYSDHTSDVMSGAFAASAGAVIVERHLTYDRRAAGPDHAASSDPEEFAEYVSLIRHADAMRGRPGKRVLEIENDVRTVSRQSLVLRRDIDSGQPIGDEDLTVQRPGVGIPAAKITVTIGRRALRNLKAGEMLQWDMLENAA